MKDVDEINRKINIQKLHGCMGNCYKCTYKCSDAETIEIEGAFVDGSFDKEYDRYGIAIDLGTTTIAAALVGVDLTNGEGEVVKTSSCVNHQRKFGSDVISRIDYASNDGNARQLRKLVLSDISSLIKELTKEVSVTIAGVCIAGNTTMLHLLRGFSVEGLGHYPYEPVSLSFEKLSAKELFGEFFEAVSDRCFDSTVHIFSGISAFVGADIVSGIYALDMAKESIKKSLMVDLGTNGEIAFFDGESIVTTSTAAGPVFEGGSLSCGVPAIAGAIKHIDIEDFSCKLDIIGDGEPIGICGTGVIEAVSEMLKAGIIDNTGLLSDKYFDEGYPVTKNGEIKVTQGDIRNIQLAKAAVYSGIKAVLEGKEPDIVYVSGGFGSHMETDKVMKLKMFPESFSGKIVAAGNTSLKGCIKYLIQELLGKGQGAISELERIVDASVNLQLANMDQFDSEYIDAMNF